MQIGPLNSWPSSGVVQGAFSGFGPISLVPARHERRRVLNLESLRTRQPGSGRPAYLHINNTWAKSRIALRKSSAAVMVLQG